MCSKRIRRRDLIKGLSLATGAFALGGHTPFKQWVVYRKKHLLISCHRADPRTYDLAREVVAVLEEHLPAAQARPARAPTAGRLASLIGTDQMDVAILSAKDTAAMRAGTGPFAPYGPIPLHILTPVQDRLLIAHARFPARHAWQVTDALSGSDLIGSVTRDMFPHLHPGSRAFIDGEDIPELE